MLEQYSIEKVQISAIIGSKKNAKCKKRVKRPPREKKPWTGGEGFLRLTHEQTEAMMADGFTMGDMKVLLHLIRATQGESSMTYKFTQEELAEKLYMARSTVQATLKRLEEDGLILYLAKGRRGKGGKRGTPSIITLPNIEKFMPQAQKERQKQAKVAEALSQPIAPPLGQLPKYDQDGQISQTSLSFAQPVKFLPSKEEDSLMDQMTMEQFSNSRVNGLCPNSGHHSRNPNTSLSCIQGQNISLGNVPSKLVRPKMREEINQEKGNPKELIRGIMLSHLDETGRQKRRDQHSAALLKLDQWFQGGDHRNGESAEDREGRIQKCKAQEDIVRNVFDSLLYSEEHGTFELAFLCFEHFDREKLDFKGKPVDRPGSKYKAIELIQYYWASFSSSSNIPACTKESAEKLRGQDPKEIEAARARRDQEKQARAKQREAEEIKAEDENRLYAQKRAEFDVAVPPAPETDDFVRSLAPEFQNPRSEASRAVAASRWERASKQSELAQETQKAPSTIAGSPSRNVSTVSVCNSNFKCLEVAGPSEIAKWSHSIVGQGIHEAQQLSIYQVDIAEDDERKKKAPSKGTWGPRSASYINFTQSFKLRHQFTNVKLLARGPQGELQWPRLKVSFRVLTQSYGPLQYNSPPNHKGITYFKH